MDNKGTTIAVAVSAATLVDQPREFTKRTSIIPFSLTALLAVVGCETIQGAGRDLSTVGEAVTAESQEVQGEM